MKPINDNVILKPNDSLMRGTIFIPERHTEAATACMVIDKGEKTSTFYKVGDVVLCEVGFGERKNYTIEGTRDFLCKDHNIYGVMRNNIILPIGNKVLIKRDVADKYVGQVVIPSNRRSQSLFGTIVRLGLTRKPFKVNEIKVGSYVRLTAWSESMQEVTLEDGSFGLIVNERDLLYYES
jgi:co-chaperonin GroES (HSP10)